MAGIGALQASAQVPPVTVSPASLSFGNQFIGISSAPQTVTLTNNQSVALNISEANRREGKDRIARFRIAAGSAAETRTALMIARAWRYVDVARAERIDELLDRVLAMLWRLTHPRA